MWVKTVTNLDNGFHELVPIYGLGLEWIYMFCCMRHAKWWKEHEGTNTETIHYSNTSTSWVMEHKSSWLPISGHDTKRNRPSSTQMENNGTNLVTLRCVESFAGRVEQGKGPLADHWRVPDTKSGGFFQPRFVFEFFLCLKQPTEFIQAPMKNCWRVSCKLWSLPSWWEICNLRVPDL